MKKKILALLMSTILLLSLMPQTALALVEYEIPDGWTIDFTNQKIYVDGVEIPFWPPYFSGDTLNILAGAGVTLIGDPGIQLYITCEEGVTLTIEDFTMDVSGTDYVCALAFTGGGNTLILSGTNTLKSGKNEPGVRVEAGTSLEITDDGETGADILTVTGGVRAACIGGGTESHCGNITISGTARITAMEHGGDGGAGIGSGNGTTGDNQGTITIKDNAYVRAIGAKYGAGIGGGIGVDGGHITIMGDPEVIAGGGINAAGIGGGSSGGGGTITITGGTVSGSGKVTAVSDGAAAIIADADGVYAVCTILVSSEPDSDDGSEEDDENDVTPTATPAATLTVSPSGGTEEVPDTGDESLEAAPTPRIEKVIITIVVGELPEGTTSVRLPSGEVIELDGSDTIQIEVGTEDLNDEGSVELIALGEEGTPLGEYIAADGQAITIPESGSAWDKIGPILMWILIGIGGLGAAGIASYLILSRRRSA